MTPKPAIIDQLVILAEAFGLPVSQARMEIYADMLADLPIEKIKAGIVHIIRTRSFAGNLPTVAEIREAIDSEGVPMESRAAIAWDKAMYALHSHGPYQSIRFDDPIIHHIIVQWGGWTEFGDWPAEQTHWKRRDFMKLYEQYAKNGGLPDPERHLIGEAEYFNSVHSPEFVPAPIFVSGSTGKFKSEKQKMIADESLLPQT